MTTAVSRPDGGRYLGSGGDFSVSSRLAADITAPGAARIAPENCGIILDSRVGHRDSTELDELVSRIGLDIEPVTLEQARVARQAYRTYGKGHHPAALDFGDCFAYALAKCMALPLLYKVGDFARTDVASAL